MEDLTYLNAQAMFDRGLLHEINRLILHPLGLALAVAVDPDQPDRFFGQLWDCQDDPEGVYYSGGLPDPAKAEAVCNALFERRGERIKALGYVIQPVPVRALTVNYVDPADQVDDDTIVFEQ